VAQDDPPLSELGKLQAKQLGAWLSANARVRYVFSSPYNRTLNTAHLIAQPADCKIYVEHAVSEWLTHETDAISNFTDQYFLKWTDRKCTEYRSIFNPTIGVESIVSVHKRARQFVKYIETNFVDKGDIVVVGHAASHIALTRAFMKDERMDVNPGTCCLTKLVRHGNGWVVEKLCDYSHLEEALLVREVLNPWSIPRSIQSELNGFSFE